MTQETRESLLMRIRDPDDVRAWQQFVSIYRPMIYRTGRRRGLQHCDAEDLTQRVLMSVARSIGAWEKDPGQSGFRAWLGRVAKNAVINQISRQPKDLSVGGTDFLELCGAAPSPEAGVEQLVNQEHARSQLRAAAEVVQQSVEPHTWDAFWLTTVQGLSVEEAATQLEVSKGVIYGARARVMKQLQAAGEAMVGAEDSSKGASL